jgi:hypothetical protein
MFDWDRERDFYADGHAGERIYVHPPTRTIIVHRQRQPSGLHRPQNREIPRRIILSPGKERRVCSAAAEVMIALPRAVTDPARFSMQ